MNHSGATPRSNPVFGRYALGCGLGAATAFVAVAVAFVGAVLVMIDESPESAEAMGSLLGTLSFPMIGASAVAGFAWTYRRWLGALLMAGVLVAALGFVGVVFALSHRDPLGQARAVTAADRVPPMPEAVDGELMFVQHAVGLALPSLTDFTYEANNAAIEGLFAAKPEVASHMVLWHYSGAAGAQQIIITVTIAPLLSPVRQTRFFGGMVKGSREAADSGDIRLVSSQPYGPLNHVLRHYIPAANINMVTRIFAYTHRDAFVVISVAVIGDASLEHIPYGARWVPD